MNENSESEVLTIILNDQKNPAERINQLLPLLYEQLRAAAQKKIASERVDHTLTATALVHEAYLKLVGPRKIPWQNRAHFYAAATEAMRQLLLDHARARGRLKRLGDFKSKSKSKESNVTIEGVAEISPRPPDFIALDEAMCRLEVKDPRAAQVVRLKYYAGLEIAEIARVLRISARTVKNDWAFARAWLERALRAESGEDRE